MQILDRSSPNMWLATYRFYKNTWFYDQMTLEIPEYRKLHGFFTARHCKAFSIPICEGRKWSVASSKYV